MLGLNELATAQQIKKAFKKLAAKYHPDNSTTGDEARFKRISAAYVTLSTPEAKMRTDQAIFIARSNAIKRPTSSFAGIGFVLGRTSIG